MACEENNGAGIFLNLERGFFPGAALLRSLPRIRRARAFRLYAEDGRRFIDLWQYGGRAVLGHTPSGVLLELKNAAARGLFAPFPGCYEGRLVKALSRIFPGKAVRLYPDEAALRRALALAGYDAGSPFPDPAFAAASRPARPEVCRASEKPAPILWRPFLENEAEAEPASPPASPLVPVMPLALAGAPQVLILDNAMETAFPVSGQDCISPAVLAAAARSVWDLIAAAPERGALKFPRIRKALGKSEWRRRGVYLTRDTEDEESWAGLFRRFLEKGFLLPPSSRSPLILPGELSPGEEAALAGCLAF
ncbi:MAG: hypothetical protein LBU18_04855 [Treponema sp.]|jgi:hypothetical protein|nr:hypothetical protein [Treponema sp.]